MIRRLILLSFLCLLYTPVFATEADFEKRMARGVAALDSGDSARAQEEFREALKEHPTDPEALLYLAIALNRGGDPDAEPALKAALRAEPGNPRINLELGTLFYNRKMFDEAGDYFENLLTLNPDAEMKLAAEGYLANIQGRSGGKRWGVTLAGGMQYDSNVPLAADGVQLPTGVDRKGDWRGTVNLALSGVPFRDNQQELAASYSMYQTLHMNLTDFNLTQNLFDVSYRRKVSPLVSLKLSGGFESILLGEKQFVNDYSITPGLLVNFKEGMVTGLDYRWRGSAFKNSDLFPANSERNGMTHAILVSHRQRLAERLNLRAGYSFERELADINAWSSSSHRGNCGVGIALSNALLLDISAEVIEKKYDDIVIGASDVRSDTAITSAASLTWQLLEHFGVSAGYHYTKNASNIPGYEYVRGITSIMIQGRY